MTWFAWVLVISWILNVVTGLWGLGSGKRVWVSSSSYAIGAGWMVIYAGLLLATSTPLTWFGVALLLYWATWFVIDIVMAILGGNLAGTKTYVYGLVLNVTLLILMFTVGV